MLPDKEIGYYCPHSYSVIIDVAVSQLLGTLLLIWRGFHVPAIPPQLLSPQALPALLHYFLVFSFVLCRDMGASGVGQDWGQAYP